MIKLLYVRWLLGVSALLAYTAGCSCSSHIPESPPGEGPPGEIKNLQTGEVVSGPVPASPSGSTQSTSPTYSQPATTNVNRPPMPGQAAPVKPQKTADTLP